MKKSMIVGVAMAIGVLSLGAVSVSAAGSCCDGGKCNQQQAVQQYSKETAELSSALKAKDVQLRELYGYEGLDTQKVNALASEIKEIKGKLRAAAEQHNIPACCAG